MDEPKVAVLRHYASPYYDPEKAHEYYMRTRELKGRSTTSLNERERRFGPIQKIISNLKRLQRSKKSRRSEIRRLRELREKAEATKEQISSRLKELNEAI